MRGAGDRGLREEGRGTLHGRGGAAAVRVPDTALGTSLVLWDRRPLLKLTAARGQPLRLQVAQQGRPPAPGAGEWVAFLGSRRTLSAVQEKPSPQTQAGASECTRCHRLATEMGHSRLAPGRRR